MKTKVIIGKLFKFKKNWQKRKARRVAHLMENVINSDEFGDRVKAYDFKDRRYRPSKNEEWKEITENAKILDILRKGNEQGSEKNDDHEWKLNIKLGRFLSQVGRREGQLIITQNWFFKIANNDHSVAGHWVHEYAHVLGFGHDFEKTDRRPHSVPYAVGTIAEEIAEKMNQ